MTVDLGPAAQPRRIPTQEERMNATDRIPAYPLVYPTTSTVGCDTADTRSQDRALREALADNRRLVVALAMTNLDLGRATEVLATVRDAVERIGRALDDHDTAPGVRDE